MTVGGNTNAVIECAVSQKGELGRDIQNWSEIKKVTGWLDYTSGDSKVSTYNKKIQESTHLFLCDYDCDIAAMMPEGTRLCIEKHYYSIQLIDDPMQLHEHLELYLKYVGGFYGK